MSPSGKQDVVPEMDHRTPFLAASDTSLEGNSDIQVEAGERWMFEAVLCWLLFHVYCCFMNDETLKDRCVTGRRSQAATSWGRAFALWACTLFCLPVLASTWYVRPDGGTRYTAGMPKGQCDGTADVAYPGSGTDRHCAFKDVRSLWQDGSYANGKPPANGWVGHGGDTYLIRGSIGTGSTYRIGWNSPGGSYDKATDLYWGLQGDPYGSGIPSPPSGTAAQHTRVLGENYASCHAASAKTQLHGGYGVAAVLSLAGSSFVDVACLDITDFSACGRAGQAKKCSNSIGTLSDYAGSGIVLSTASTQDTLTDVHIHGLAGNGMYGPTGDGMVFSYLDLIGNAGSGWNADLGNGTTGTGSLQIDHFNISWNGCAEEYPVVDKEPYGDCTDDSSGGYGDGFGTATVDSHPAWNVTFDQGVVFNNTQDGLDALHIGGTGSSMTVAHVLAYGNMGQQVKVGGAAGTLLDNRIVTNCNALRQRIPGTPPGYNANLSDFCRAADTGVLVTVNDQVPLRFRSNVIYSASLTAVEVECATAECTSAAKIDFRDNTFIGFRNDKASGYPNGGRGDFSNPIYLGTTTNPFKNAGSVYSGNVTFHPVDEWKCPAAGETRAVCGDPHRVDETWHLYGYGDMSPKGGAQPAAGLEGTEPDPPNANALVADQSSAPPPRLRVRAAECLCAGVLAFSAWRGIRYLQSR